MDKRLMMDFGLTLSEAKNNKLLKLFASYVDIDVSECLSIAAVDNDSDPDYSDSDDDDDDDGINAIFANWHMNSLKMALQALLKSISNINYTDADGQTFLHRFLEIFRLVQMISGSTKLSTALEIVQNVLDGGASVDPLDDEGESPLQIAVDNNQHEILQLMFTKLEKICLCRVRGCSNRYEFSAGRTPLHVYSINSTVELLRMCLENEVDFDMHITYGTTPLIMVCEYPLHSIHVSTKLAAIDRLKKMGYDINAVDAVGHSALHYAIEFQGFELVKRLIGLGADVNKRTEERQTPLYLALRAESLEKIKLLLKSGADVNNIRNAETNVSALMFAMSYTLETAIIRCLIDFGANLNCRDEVSGFTPLHIAALNYNDPDLFNLMIEKGCTDVKDRTASGLTTLHLASGTGTFEIVDALIERGADVNDREPTSGLTPMHMASMRADYYRDIVNQRTSFGHTPNSVVHYQSRNSVNQRHSVIASLMKGGADVNVRDSHGLTPLHYATIQVPEFIDGNDVLPALLNSGAHVNRPADDGHLPLHNVLKNRNIYALMYLMRFGVDLDDIELEALHQPWQLLSNEFRQYMAKLNIAGFSNVDIASMQENSANNTIYEEYLKEVEELKKYFIENKISLYNWLHMNHAKAQPFYLSKVPLEMKSKFPHYYEIIQARYHNFVERISLLEPAKLAWYQITKIDLPDICVERICFFVSNRYLHLLVDSSKKEDI